jgi:hypothetical protein
VFLGGSLITWKTKKQVVVSRSIAEVELRAMASLTAEVTWLCWLLEDFGMFVTALTSSCQTVHALSALREIR